MALYDAVQDILEKAKDGPVAVFKIDNKVRVIPISNCKRYNAMLVDNHKDLVGVFTADCPVAVLKENLE